MNNPKITLVDTTLRDGSHAVSHSFTPEQARAIVSGLDQAGIQIIEVAHGDGIAGSSINYGFLESNECDLHQAAVSVMERARLAVLLIPGIGTIENLEQAHENGASIVRVATHCTEADIGIQHISYAKRNGIMPVGFLMMAHMVSPEQLYEQAMIFVDAGADYVNIADSAGYLLPDGVRTRIDYLAEKLPVPVGFHAHNNLGLAIANSLAAVESGASYIDGTCRGLGAGAGNCQIEVLAGILKRQGYGTDIDFYRLLDVAEEIVGPAMKRPQIIDNASMMLGYSGVYSSFLLHTYRAAEKFGVNPLNILVELGNRKMVGGQEDMIVDVAYQLSQSK